MSLNKDPAWLEERKKRALPRSQTVVRSVGDRIHVLLHLVFPNSALFPERLLPGKIEEKTMLASEDLRLWASSLCDLGICHHGMQQGEGGIGTIRKMLSTVGSRRGKNEERFFDYEPARRWIRSALYFLKQPYRGGFYRWTTEAQRGTASCLR